MLLSCSWARHFTGENPTHVAAPGELPGYGTVTVLYVQLCVKNNFAQKEQNVQLKKTHTVTTQMFNVLHFRWTGHLPVAILYAPSASVWFARKFPAHFIGPAAMT